MGYVTFVSQQRAWRLYRGIGSDGELLAEINDMLPLHDLNAAYQPILWVCSQNSGDEETSIQRVKLPALSSEHIAWSGGRVGALASDPEGQRAVALELPSSTNERPYMQMWDGHSWNTVETEMVPDISSKLAWLDVARIVCESANRRLTILNLDTGSIEIGPPGCCPAAAGDIREWYAIGNGQVLRFPYEQSFSHPPTTLDGFSFGDVTTLRVTRDGRVFTWTEPRFGYRSKGYIQHRGQRRKRFQRIDEGIGAVLGPYSAIAIENNA